MVDQTARCPDHDIHAAFELGYLLVNAPAPVDRKDAHIIHEIRQVLQFLRDLDAQLPGRDKDQGIGLAPSGQSLQQWKSESGGLPSAGLGLGDDVLAIQQERQGLFLDRGRVNEPHAVDGLQY